MIPANLTPLLLTADVEIAHDRNIDRQSDALWRLADTQASTPITWFCTADAAERFAKPLRALAKAGHTIACHGRDHGAWEDYRLLSADKAMQTLTEATHRIEQAVGVRPRAFRGPRMTTSAATQAALRELGYVADFSVCARRFDLMLASRFNPRWLATSPIPYRPEHDDPFAVAGQPEAGELTVVPLSGMGVPLVSGALYILGERVMQGLARLLTHNARRTGAPLVYLFHSYEFVDLDGVRDNRPIHHRFYPATAEARWRVNSRFLSALQSDLGLQAISAEHYLGGLSHDTSDRQPNNPDRASFPPAARAGRRTYARTDHAWSAERQSFSAQISQLQAGDGGGCPPDEDAAIHHPVRQ